MRTFTIVILFALMVPMISTGQHIINLYMGKIPNSKPSPNEEKTEQTDGITIVSKISIPTLAIYLPEPGKGNGTAVVICPGGGYTVNAISHEGTDVARQFASMGVAAFMLKYRIPNDATMEKKEAGPLGDAQQAIRIVRQQAKEWSVDPNKVGIMGFSAGGHLASTVGTHFADGLEIPDNVTNLRPDFMILIYPVISFQDSLVHAGSREQLIGKNPTAAQKKYFSGELNVTPKTPPTFLVHATDDEGVTVGNSVAFYEALVKHHVPAEIHVYEKGGHGFGMNNPTTADRWMDRLKNWMTSNGWVKN